MKSDRELKTELQSAEFELLVPANNKDIAIKAIDAGADAVYIGYSKFGARIQAGNSFADLIDIIEYAHVYGVKIYITLNTILKDSEIKDIENLIWRLYNIKADGIIIQDMGILECNLPPIKIIASTQCHNNTLEKIQFLEKTGLSRVILPREITLNEIKEIRKNTNIQLECFIHGALCMSYSGQCYMSYVNGGRSANRGECAQPCRKKYSLYDSEGKCIAENKYLLSLKDLNLSEKIEDLIFAGITSFKIEGRLKNTAYVINTTSYYRQLLDKILDNYGLKRSSTGVSKIDFEPDLNKSFNRGFTEFYINGEKKDIGTLNYTASLGEYLGVVESVKKNYFTMKSNVLNNGDGICFFDEKQDLKGTNINKTEGNVIYPAEIKGIHEGLKIYRNYNKVFDDKINNSHITRKLNTRIKVRETEFAYLFFIEDDNGNVAVNSCSKNIDMANNADKAIVSIKVQLSKSGNTEFFVSSVDINIKHVPFFKVSKINEIRRTLMERLRKIRRKNYIYSERKNNIQVFEYPVTKLDYKANIYNEKAALFYKRRGCYIEEYALESQNDFKNKDVMISKYCIKNQLGLCPKQMPIKKFTEPFVLKDECNKEYLVAFNCKDCVMRIGTKL